MSRAYNRIRNDQTLPIPGGLNIGSQIVLHGKVKHQNDRFSINIKDNDGNILFHFNPRHSDNVVVRNSLIGGGWGGEERDQPYYPFNRGTYFCLRIEVTESEYRTYINGKPFIEYRHRLDPKTGTFLQLADGVEYYDVKYQGGVKQLPFKAEIPGRLKVGTTVRVRGTGKGSNGFSINFSCDDNGDNIAFHFNPRPQHNVVVMNSKLGGWGPEERDFEGDYPFYDDMYFDISILCTEEQYHVYVNDNHFADYKHRCDLQNVSHLQVNGDMNVADIEFLEIVDDDIVKEIPSGLEKGDVILCKGVMDRNQNGFAINLHRGLSKNSDIGLHFNPRLNQGQIVFNKNINGNWGAEERVGIPSVISERRPFEVKIVAKRKAFKILVNGVKCYKYRVEPGDIEKVLGVTYGGGAYMYQIKLQRKLDNPVVEKIPGGLLPGNWIFIHGMPKKNCDRFHINLQCGEDNGNDVAFHLNPRFGQNVTVRNTKVNGGWQNEERDADVFPFGQKDEFDLFINVRGDKFVTYVDGKRFIDYNYRLPLDRVTHLECAGRAEFYETEFF